MNTMITRPQRLNRIIAEAGLTSRRKADEWIKKGRVSVNGRRASLGMKAVWGRDIIKVDGKNIPDPPEKIYVILNKPFGYISSLRDPKGRPIITDLLAGIRQRVYPVGRLDFDTMGLLLLTNDGELTYKLTHPKFQVPRTYKATIAGEIRNDVLNIIRRGIKLADGPVGKVKIKSISSNEKQSILRITVYQGRSRMVRRIFEAVGYRVIHLIRTGFANLMLGDLKVGEYRYLEKHEVESLKRFIGLRSN